MPDLDKWVGHGELSPEDEPEYLKDLCAYLREQETLSAPERNEEGSMVCSVVPDEIAAHAADIIEELYQRIEKLQYELREVKSV